MEETVAVFVKVLVLMGMFVALMLPILAVPYLFIKMGSVAGKVQAKMGNWGKQQAKNSAPGQALAQRRAIRNQVRTERGRRMLASSGSVIGGGVRKDSRGAFKAFQAGEERKEVARHMDAMRAEAPGKLYKTATTSKNAQEREAAMQIIARSGYDTQLNALHDMYGKGGTNTSDTVATAAWQRTTADNFGSVKKEAPKAVGKGYETLSQEAILDMGSDSFVEAMSTNAAARATFAQAMANPQLRGRAKQIHTNYHTTGALPTRSAPDV